MSRREAKIWMSNLIIAGAFAAGAVFVTWTPAAAQDQKTQDRIAQDQAAQDHKPKMDEKALSVLKAMSTYLGSRKTISFRARTFYDVALQSGTLIKTGRDSTVLLKRPKELNIRADADDGSGTTIWFDGTKLTFWLRNLNQVMSLDFKGTTDEMLNHLIDKYDAQIPLSDLFYSNVGKSLSEDLIAAEYVGLRVVDGVNCHQLAFQSPGVNWQIWIEADETPVPRRFVMDFVDDGSKPQYMVQLDAWSIGGDIADYNFVAGVPKSVKHTEFKLKP
jgi:hypothetical protein